MIGNAANAGSYFRTAQSYQSKPAFTPTDAAATATTDEGKAGAHAKGAIPVSALKKLDTSGLMAVSLKDNPRIRDQIATNWLDARSAQQTVDTSEPDNTPQNAYATVKVGGKVVATVYNGGSAEMTIDTIGKVGSLPDPDPNGGPDVAQARAEYIAKAVGGTIEASPTAITQSEWKQRPDASKGYSRAELDAAFQAIMTGASISNRSSGSYADFSA